MSDTWATGLGLGPGSSTIGRNTYLPMRLFYVFMLIFFGIVIYRMVTFYKRDKEESPLIINEPKSAKQALVINKERIKRPEVGNDMSFSFWMYINDWNYNLDRPKHVFHVGDQAMRHICPGVWLYPRENNLMVRIDTFENVNDVKYNRYPSKEMVGCSLGESGQVAVCRQECDKDEKCNGYTVFKTDGPTKCRYVRGSKRPPEVLKDNNMGEAFYKLRTKNPLYNNDNSEYNVTKQCDVAEMRLQTWTHVAVVISENNLRVYINGRLARNCELSSMPKMNDGELYINLDGGFDGLISQFRFHREAITEAEVVRLYRVAHVADPRALAAALDVTDYIPTCRIGLDVSSPNVQPTKTD